MSGNCPICGGSLQPWDLAEPDPDGWCDLCSVKGELVYQCPASRKRIQARMPDFLDLTFNAPGYGEYRWTMTMGIAYSMLTALCEVEHLEVGKSVEWKEAVHKFRAVRTPEGVAVRFSRMEWDCVFSLDQMQSFIGTLTRMVEGGRIVVVRVDHFRIVSRSK